MGLYIGWPYDLKGVLLHSSSSEGLNKSTIVVRYDNRQ